MTKFKKLWKRINRQEDVRKGMSGKARVWAQAFDLQTGESLTQERAEIIDLDTNELFAGVESTEDIKAAYEAFWAMGNKEDVRVSRVEYPI